MIEQIVEGSHLKRIDNIVQWQERDVFQRESVSQHSFKVSVFTRVILEDILGGDDGRGRWDKFKLDCVTHALFHDFDEAIFLRDISHSVKYNKFNGQEIKEAINHYVSHQFFEEFGEDDGKYSDSLKMLHKSIVSVDPEVKEVVKVADWMALLYFCRRELSLGNVNFKETYEYCKESLFKSANKMVYDLAAKSLDIEPQKFIESINKIISSDYHGKKDF